MWAYDLASDTWTESGRFAPTDATLRFYDPVSGIVVATGDDGDPDTRGSELWSYEVETDTWTRIRQANRLAIEPQEYVYDASVDRMVAYSSAGGQLGGGHHVALRPPHRHLVGNGCPHAGVLLRVDWAPAPRDRLRRGS